MHKGFIDKNRRLFNLRQMQVEGVLPEHFGQYYPKFIALLEKYYDWQGARESVELIQHLFASRDVNEVDIALLSFIEDELLLGDAYIEGFGDTDAEIRAAANFSNILFRSKGSKFAIEWFFRSFYGIDAEVLYPKENVFTLNNSTSTLGPDSLRYLTDDKLYQTFSLLVKTSLPISKWNDIFKLFSHPAGMYLGGEVLVSDTNNVVVSPKADDSAVFTSQNKSYSLSVAGNEYEGAAAEFTVTGTNVPEGIDALFYYIEHIETTDSDFVDAVPTEQNPQYFSIENSTGSFSIQHRLDSDGSEQFAEEYKVFIKDFYDIVYDSETTNILNVGPTYTVSTEKTSYFENETIEVTINATNLPAQNSTVYWYLLPDPGVTLTSADWTSPDPMPLSRNDALPVQIVDGVGTVTLEPSFDDFNDASSEGFTFRVTPSVGSFQVLASKALTLENFNLTITYDVASTYTEGDDIVITVTVNDEFFIGTSVFWSISNTDSRFADTNDSFVIESLSQDYTIVGTTVDDLYNGTTAHQLTLSAYGLNLQRFDFSLVDQSTEVSITPSVTSATEGDTVTFNVSGTNIPDGTYYFAVNHITTTDADFTVAPPTSTRQAVTITNNASTSPLSLTFATDGQTVNESFAVELYTVATGGSAVTSLPYTIIGGGVFYNLTPDSPTSVDEGSAINAELTGGGFSDGQYYYWVEVTGGSDITNLDFTSLSLPSSSNRGTFNVTSEQGDFSIQFREDHKLENAETLVIKVSDSPTGGAVATSAEITINDTSVQTYTLDVDSTVTEGSSLGATVTPNFDASQDTFETLWLVLTGPTEVTDRVSELQYESPATVWTSWSRAFTTLSTDTYEGPQTGTISLHRGSPTGTVLASQTFTMVDQNSAYTLTAVDATPDEGDTITFNITGTNLPSGTHYYSIQSDIITSQTDGTASSGTSFIPLASTTGIVFGMSSNSNGVNGTVTNVNAGVGVTMSQNLSENISSGTAINFADPTVFDDFDTDPTGSFTVSNNSGQFTVDTANNNDYVNDTYTFVIRDQEYGGTDLATESITITDTTGEPVSYSLSTTTISDVEIAPNFAGADSYIRFNADGTVDAIGNVSPGVDTVYTQIGTWITGTFDPNNYTINASFFETPASPAVAVGSYGTDINLGTASAAQRAWGVFVDASPAGTGYLRDMTVDFTITQTSTPQNTQTQRIVFTVRATATFGGDNDGDGVPER